MARSMSRAVTHVDRAHIHLQRRRHRLDYAELGRSPEDKFGSRRIAARVMLGAISLSNSSHLPLSLNSNMQKASGVAARPRQAFNEASTDWIGDDHEHNRHSAGSLQQRSYA